MAATADDTARLLVSIEATQKKFEKQLAGIAKAAGDTATGIENKFKRANDNAASSFVNSGRKVEQSLGAQRAAVSNLSFQLNDIAMGLASGTSPFTIMVQQGSQVSQVLQGSGGLVGAIKTLGGAFTQMINPVSLASFALIGLTGAAVQYLMTLKSDVPDAEKLLKAHAELIKSFDDAWGIAKKGVEGYSESVNKIELQKLRDEFGSLQKAIEAAGKDLKSDVLSVPVSEFGGATQSVMDFQRALGLLNKEIPDFRDFSLEMERIEGMKGIPDNIRELAKQLRLSANESLPLQEALEATDKRLKTLYLTGEQAKDAFATLTSTAIGLGLNGGNAISDIAGKIKTELIPAMGQALTQVGEYAKNLNDLQTQINKSPLGALSPLYSGGGKFLDREGANAQDFNDANLDEVGKSAAAKLIRGFEGFITNAKWDTNHFRVGFGSDTATRANGQIEEVTKDTIVTLDDAQRDLSRRIMEFQNGIQNAIGLETWKSLSEGQQAALTSIAYNYGSLPDAIVNAIKGGGGPEKVAKAIAALTSNPSRRKEEAQTYLSGSGISMNEAGLGDKKSPDQLFQGDVADVQKRIDMLNAQYAAQAKLNPLVNDYGFAVEKARIQQELLSEAQKAGVSVTPELAASIDALATNYAKASSAGDQLKASQEQIKKSAEAFRDLGRDVVGGFISDLRSGKSAAEALANALNKVVDKLIDVGLNAVFSGGGLGGLLGGGGGKGGLLGGMIIPGILHSGGVAGADGYGHGRSVSPRAFAGAKRYHTGGVAGLQPGEVPAILQRGEVVLPRGTKMGGSGKTQVQVGVSVDDTGGLRAYVKSVSNDTVAAASPRIVSAASQNVVPTMAKYQNESAGGDYRNG
ncbi:phage tail tape-measure protein [Rhizobium leguminosarum]|uniref:phage tail length tape measure family protein n=1 Tax=Rhizobium leguminosarum TaxID=384 RepID=UPI00103D8EA0|nr:phage tail length tape measure family protein [Rhizobium leguminosarum]MBY5503140.1 phage tail tape-measure protein [Rhizobium leguminosarum]NKK31557.1 phage tail tape-measure protein [Rhizobium leguminosarum bv. viciae]TBZ40314.1 phage tail tape-measure protein [Rhizobium leguminosarum bv. viciae]